MSPASHMVGRLRTLYGIVLGRTWALNARQKNPPRASGAPAPRGVMEPLEPRLLLSAYTLHDVVAFTAASGALPYGGVIMDAGGNLFGAASNAGTSDGGTVFEILKGSSTATPLASFDGVHGSVPAAGLLMDGAGNLYGTTDYGGAYGGGWGTVFELAKGASSITTLASFDYTHGEYPISDLVMDSSGNLYGTTSSGGDNYDGTVFEVVKGSGQVTTLASFNGANGQNPEAGLVMDAAGNLYGTTTWGGASSQGTVFELAKGSHTIDVLASFNGTNGANPQADLLMDASGNLYGTAASGGDTRHDGTLFEVVKGSRAITVLASFNNGNGSMPHGGLIMDAGGNLYGTTFVGGSGGDGTVFEWLKSSGEITDLATFYGALGTYPEAGVIMDSGGNIYGTTYGGGANGQGVVFELTPNPTVAAIGPSTGTTAGGTLVTLIGTHLLGATEVDFGGTPAAIVSDTANRIVVRSPAAAAGAVDVTVVTASGRSDTSSADQFTYVAPYSFQDLAAFNVGNGEYPQSGLIEDGVGNLYGTTHSGGDYNEGTVFEVAAGSNAVTTLVSFYSGSTGGFYPMGGLVMDGAGNLYGTTDVGGDNGNGTVFELPTDGSGGFTTLASFAGFDGSNPEASLIMDDSGNLYGTTYEGGDDFSDGTVFELASGSHTITTLATFSGGTGGNNPQCALVMDGDGNLFGTTRNGGDNDLGTVFEVASGSGAVTTLASFNGGGGAFTEAGLVMDGDGNLYGTTFIGGDTGNSSVFEVVKDSGTITTLASLDGTNGSNITAGLIIDASGNLYGTAQYGGDNEDGVVFELPSGSHTITALASFNGANGSGPVAGLLMDDSGNLFGTTLEGGDAQGHGTVFELASGSHTITALALFNGNTGDDSEAGLIRDAAGNLYGTTKLGGEYDDGTVFELASGSSTPTVLASFSGDNGSCPEAGLIMDADGNLYGTTYTGGGIIDYGTVFEVAKDSGTITTLAVFDGTQGQFPEGSLVMDAGGNLYGTTNYGGDFNAGTLFELAAGSGTIRTLASFDGTNGAYPLGGLTMDSSGNLFGASSNGGANYDGTVYELVKGSHAITLLVTFDGTNGAHPWEASLLVDAAGNLYGTASGGGDYNAGTVFEVVKNSGAITTLATFDGNNGSVPEAGLVMDSSGNLFGTTNSGGENYGGTVFEVVKGSGAITTLMPLDNATGQGPMAGLILDASGNLYGTTTTGGVAVGNGVIFKLSPSALTAPTVAITSATDGLIAGQGWQIALSAAAVGGTPGTVTGVEFFDNGTKIAGGATLHGSVWTYTWDSSAASFATHTLTAKVTDSAGQTGLSGPVSVTVRIPADGNGDGIVDGEDYGIWQNGYNHPGATFATGDYNGDGVVDGEDYGIWQNNYNSSAKYAADTVIPTAAASAPVVADVAPVTTMPSVPPATPAASPAAATAVVPARAPAQAALAAAPRPWLSTAALPPPTVSAPALAAVATEASLEPDGGLDLLALPAIVLLPVG